MKRALRWSCVVWLLAGALPGSAQPVAPSQVDHNRLPALLRERGFHPPERFKCLVWVLELGACGTPSSGAQPCPLNVRAFDYQNTSDDREDWWPASSVKLFAAIAALERTHQHGLSPMASVAFEYETGRVRVGLDQIVRDALIPSSNVAFDRLVEIVGLDEMNQRFLSSRNGLTHTVLLRSYAGRVRNQTTGISSLRNSPRVRIVDGRRRWELPERISRQDYNCPEEGNCTTLSDLAEAMRRLMLHEHLAAQERFQLGPAELDLIRSSLAAQRPRGQEVVDGLRAAFGTADLELHHKAGYALQWFSDNVFVYDKARQRRFIVAMAGYPGRGALTEAARHVGALLAEDAL